MPEAADGKKYVASVTVSTRPTSWSVLLVESRSRVCSGGINWNGQYEGQIMGFLKLRWFVVQRLAAYMLDAEGGYVQRNRLIWILDLIYRGWLESENLTN